MELARHLIERIKAIPDESVSEIGGRQLSDWIAWAEERARRLDPLARGPTVVFKNIADITEYTTFQVER